ncbi:MAG TPA: SAM-dependent methyltransferase [Candidatus Bilamarchaeaceae archaeon]|nr:SAM-dependent methyltransferase [Candidatus Bilamarchaeaceae archaeon]
MEYVPLDVLQKGKNQDYYKKRGVGIYNDFKTFGSSRLISEANAIEFYNFAKGLEEISIYEFGVGNGKFAFFFLKKLKEIDGNILKKITYYLCDISEKMLKEAEKINKFANIVSINNDALTVNVKNATYVRSNELYDDLPAKMFAKRENHLYEVYYSEKLDKKYVRKNNKKIFEFMKQMPEDFEIPINQVALKHLKKCVKNTKGYIDVFDYGFYDIGEIKLYPKEMWNNMMVREFNGQITVDVNFFYLAKNINHNSIVQWQQDYVERIYKKKLYSSEKDQLYYSTKKKDVEENYEYKHMRIEGIR